ncbi:MAG: hypothetical protein A2X94_03210 [Bdellovibrionales bacterium GWB1_55_8]|nr:MAG: hypothetical protein A2X94_03210 [Bdellovibrionales bacterium GWB1_55_8]
MSALSYVFLQIMAAVQFSSIFLGPVLIAVRIYMQASKKGSLRARRVVTIAAIICCFLAASQLAWHYYFWPNIVGH